MGLFDMLNKRVKTAKTFLKNQNYSDYMVGHLFYYHECSDKTETIVGSLKQANYKNDANLSYGGMVAINIGIMLKLILLGNIDWLSSDDIYNFEIVKISDLNNNTSIYDPFEGYEDIIQTFSQENKSKYVVGNLFETLFPNAKDFVIVGECFVERFVEQDKFNWVHMGEITCSVGDLVKSFRAKDINWLHVLIGGGNCFNILDEQELPENVLLYKDYLTEKNKKFE